MVAILKPREAPGFIEISSAREIHSAMEYAERSLYPVRIVGRPGTGKTTALRHYGSADERAAYCLVGAAQKGIRGMYQMVLAAFGAEVHNSTLSELANNIYTDLGERWELPMLIVDEFQTLEPAILRELLNIHETLKFALVLAGNGQTLVQRKTDTAAMAQIEDRIGMHVEVGGLSADDITQLANAYNVEGRDAYTALTHYGLNTNVRQLVELLEECKRICGSAGIQRRHLEATLLLKRSNRAALKLFAPSEDA